MGHPLKDGKSIFNDGFFNQVNGEPEHIHCSSKVHCGGYNDNMYRKINPVGKNSMAEDKKEYATKARIISEVLIGEVEDASDDEMDNSVWVNRKPSEGEWMEP